MPAGRTDQEYRTTADRADVLTKTAAPRKLTVAA